MYYSCIYSKFAYQPRGLTYPPAPMMSRYFFLFFLPVPGRKVPDADAGSGHIRNLVDKHYPIITNVIYESADFKNYAPSFKNAIVIVSG